MSDADARGGRARTSGGTSKPRRSRASKPRTRRRAADAQPQPEVEPEKERLERLRSVLERKSKFG
jgi:hypothetical protein